MMIPRLLLQSNRKLPEIISTELVTMLIAGRVPILVMALTVILVAAFSASAGANVLTLVLASTILCLLAIRFTIVTLFLRTNAESRSPKAVERWGQRYARIIICYAACLGVFNAVACIGGDTATHIIVVAEIFGFCAGQVSRGTCRPKLCAAAVLLGALPTAIGMFVTATQTDNLRESAAYIVAALLIALFAFSSLETIAYSYRTLVAQLESKRQMAGLARLDALTGLPNRLVFLEQLELEISRLYEGGPTFALHLIDLDGFKQINDSHGHPVGDAILCAVSDRLTKLLRFDDVAVRLGGDEFAVIQRGIAVADEANLLGRRIVRQLAKPFRVGDITVRIGASDGIAHALVDTDNLHHLIEHADGALYVAKRAGGGNVSMWQPNMTEVATKAA